MYPKINQNILLEVSGYDQTCHSMAAELDREEILIAYPSDGEWFGSLPDGTNLTITYITAGTLYQFHTKIVGKKNEKIRLYRVAKPAEKDIKKIQRRDNFRVKTNLGITLKDTTANTINISAGGALCVCRKDLEVKAGDTVSGTLLVPNQKGELEAVSFHSLVNRVIPGKETNQVALAFTWIDQRDQMKIVQYCFIRQRQMR